MSKRGKQRSPSSAQPGASSASAGQGAAQSAVADAPTVSAAAPAPAPAAPQAAAAPVPAAPAAAAPEASAPASASAVAASSAIAAAIAAAVAADDSAPKPSQPPESAPASRPARGAKIVVLGGMRSAERTPCHVSALMEGMRGVVPVTLLDVSASGALLTIDAPAFKASAHGKQARLHAQLCERHLGTSSMLVLGAVRISILPVRWVSQAGPERCYGMAVRFAEPRTAAQLAEILAQSTPHPASKPPGTA